MTEQTPESDIEAAWSCARPISGQDPALYRIAPDIIQSVIRRDRFNIRGKFGWRIEYGRPVAYREVTTESAIRALQRDNAAVNGRQAESRTTGRSQR